MCVCVCVFVVAEYVSWTTGKERAVALVAAVAGSVAEFHQLHISRYIIYTHTRTNHCPAGNFNFVREFHCLRTNCASCLHENLCGNLV